MIVIRRIKSLFPIGALFLLLAAMVPQHSFAGTDFEVEGNIVHMDYEITSRTYSQFVRLHQQNPQVDTILMHVIDGSTDDDMMIKLGYYLRKHRFKTMLHSESEIYSGGVDLFLAGVERTMERGAIIGVHSWSDGERDGAEFPRSSGEHAKYTRYAHTMLGSDQFYWFTLEAAPADDIHIMSESEIRKYRLLTKPIGSH
ncbi:hypothetical protein [Maritalea mediterranea]|uniref:Alpha/beta hydrolase n=1 Tax=Maritalea mediterranea TaxID=2909667 RepID=A0ABS9EBJ8_9HYPH|nr:hypothetical protein [Maritalea mediterranea]MCF4099562.1 hypothetical protein [Maritalea mediterranea]